LTGSAPVKFSSKAKGLCFLVLLVPCVAAVICAVAWIVFLSLGGTRSEGVIADEFLNALLRGDADRAGQYLTTDLKATVARECPNGSVVECVADLVSSWGELEGISFALGSGSTDTVLFHTSWSELSRSINVVVIMEIEDDKWAVAGWRGFVPFEDGNVGVDLLRGSRLDNQFPAP